MPIVINKTNDLIAMSQTGSRCPIKGKRIGGKIQPNMKFRFGILLACICALVGVVYGVVASSQNANASDFGRGSQVVAMRSNEQGDENMGSINMLRKELDSSQ